MHLSVTAQGSTLIWRLQRPERLNALGPTLGQALLTALENLQKQLAPWSAGKGRVDGGPPVRCLLLTAEPVMKGTRGPVWIAGGDLKELRELKEPQAGRAYAQTLASVCSGLQDLPIPVLAAIDGLAVGGGVELALAADLRLATQRSSLHFKQIEVGLATGYGSCQRLIALTGLARATDLLLRCRQLSAREAASLALINELVNEPAELELRALALAEQLAGYSAASLRAQKQMLQLSTQAQRSELIRQELDIFESLWMQADHRRFLADFTGKT